MATESVERVERELAEVEGNPYLTAEERIWRLEGVRGRASKAQVDVDQDYIGEGDDAKTKRKKKLRKVLKRLKGSAGKA